MSACRYSECVFSPSLPFCFVFHFQNTNILLIRGTVYPKSKSREADKLFRQKKWPEEGDLTMLLCVSCSHIEGDGVNPPTIQFICSMPETCMAMGKERGLCRILVRKPEGTRPLGRLRRRWEDNINKYLQEVAYGSMDSFELSQDRDRWRALVNAVMNLVVP